MFSRLGYLFIFIVFIVLPFALHPIPSFAFTMENQNLRLELPDVLGEKIFPTPFKKAEQEKIETSKPLVIRGFPDQNSSRSFSFTLSSPLLDFGIITPTDPVIRTVNLIAQQGGALSGFAVLVSENHSPRAKTGEEINDTLCDSGICNEIIASPWTNPLVFGLGLRVDNVQGQAGSNIFKQPFDYAQVANLEASKSAIPIMEKFFTPENNRNDEVRITFKTNVSATQKEGIYQNAISFIAIPNY